MISRKMWVTEKFCNLHTVHDQKKSEIGNSRKGFYEKVVDNHGFGFDWEMKIV